MVQPSRYEGFGLTVVEGMVAGIPVLVTNVEGPMEIINHGEFGYFFESGNAASCAGNIFKIINEYYTTSFFNKLRRARIHAIDNYDIQNTVNRYLQEYECTRTTTT